MTFEDYVVARGPALVRLARLLTGDSHRAEDLVQEALGRAYARWWSISRMDRPDVYVRRILINVNSSWWRRRSSHETPVTSELMTAALDRSAAGRVGSDLSTAAAERDAMWRLIAALPPRQRAVLVLRYYEDLDDGTIAEILDCTKTTVRTHTMRALAALRTQHPVNK
ncbi:SigE family RNA polymerase sigma factor [Solwaraspora sp. WMMD937]|uniref:SigE family RNA polymerase sigma factor n=1 Tax=Solwaraspora sp. WMMD937 TaxID=3016090 RepID=UPI00249C1935|nr:SigE family RNA polymerase sigma factor [Solwaraspora sp. WMMD937]WFE23284.1 SigE family RNA polymerase sigma factor [Solwaraspora sp. WMMD937]